jgi:hypothetical protein
VQLKENLTQPESIEKVSYCQTQSGRFTSRSGEASRWNGKKQQEESNNPLDPFEKTKVLFLKLIAQNGVRCMALHTKETTLIGA